MSGARDMLCDTARAVFAEAVTAGMAPVETSGFGLLLVPEDDGGFGGDWGDANAVLRIAGVMVPDLPVAELIAGEALQPARSEEHTSELQSLMRISYAVFCLKKKTKAKEKYQQRIDTEQK